MSAAAPARTIPAAPARPRTSPDQRREKPRSGSAGATKPSLVLAPAPQRSTRGLFIAAFVGILVLGLAATLLLHTWAAQDGFNLAKLQAKQARLSAREQLLNGREQQLESPSHLRAAAAKLGMIPSYDPSFLVLPSGKVVGHPTSPPVQPVVVAPATSAKSTTAGTAQSTTAGTAQSATAGTAQSATAGTAQSTTAGTARTSKPTSESAAKTADPGKQHSSHHRH